MSESDKKEKKKSGGIPIILLRSKYHSRCRNCGMEIEVGDILFFFPTIKTPWGGKKFVCRHCFFDYVKELMAVIML